ncbi:MAG: thioredoxin family protein [Ignavibacteriales bacterium]|nr:thioredoxin family protein [Ignavibacteriales bacterium]
MNIQELKAKALTYGQYKDKLQNYIATTDESTLAADAKEKYGFIKLNLVRMARIDKIYTPSDTLIKLLSGIQEPQYWMILTMGPCGDSAQNIPHFVKMAETNSNIEILLLERDANLEIMDAYLTDGKRSVPKVAAFSANGEELFTWGSRPKEAQEVVSTAINAGLTKAEWEPKLHLWYARDKGMTLEKEVTALLMGWSVSSIYKG